MQKSVIISRKRNSPQVVPGEPFLPPEAAVYPLSMFHLLTIFNSSSLTVTTVVLPHHHLATLGRARLTPSTNQALFAMLAVRSIIWNNKTFSTSERRLIRGPSALAISQRQIWKSRAHISSVLSNKLGPSIKKRGHGMEVAIAASTSSHTSTDKESVCEEGS